jgi:hypothetical protein
MPLFIFDPQAQDILNQVDYDITRLRVPIMTIILIWRKVKKLDAITRHISKQLGNNSNKISGA